MEIEQTLPDSHTTYNRLLTNLRESPPLLGMSGSLSHAKYEKPVFQRDFQPPPPTSDLPQTGFVVDHHYIRFGDFPEREANKN